MTTHDGVWRIPTAHPALAAGEVHVWRVALDWPAPASLVQLLAADERQRAERFHFERDRTHFVVGRATLRILLGRYLGRPPEQLQFSYNAYGKPALPGAGPAFNLAHAHGLALYAFSWGRALGVDLEYIRGDIEAEQIAERFFSPAERAALAQLPVAERRQAFFSCWTRKEAYIKAHGLGLALPLDQFDVSLAPGAPARLLATHTDPADAARWSLCALAPGPGWAAALAVAGHAWQLRCWQGPPGS
ncbi:MAG: 4'-phosphopantetheinyl transferase superfamily protein [Kouleothrix sp.]|jgi:4'-phosphopantetheinyl transferase|nr:4'-phosphopantetheinyl transferase superfamily protein [Kouleothrix sp.]